MQHAVQAVAKADIEDELEPGTRRHYTRFARCSSCQRLFWRGSHYQAMQSRLGRLMPDADQDAPIPGNIAG